MRIPNLILIVVFFGTFAFSVGWAQTVKKTVNKPKRIDELWAIIPDAGKAGKFNYGLYSTIVVNTYTLNGSTGGNKNTSISDALAVSKLASSAGRGLLMGVTSTNINTNLFLSNENAQNQFISTILPMRAKNGMLGISLNFSGLDARYRSSLLRFMSKLFTRCKKSDSRFKLCLTIPGLDEHGGYDIKALSAFVDKFLVDFGQVNPKAEGPPAMLKGGNNYTIDGCMSRYLNCGIKSEKFIIILPLYGLKWSINNKGVASNPKVISYSQIRLNYKSAIVTHDEKTSSALIEIKNKSRKITSRIWFDDSYTFGKKIDFARENSLAGIGIFASSVVTGNTELAKLLSP